MTTILIVDDEDAVRSVVRDMLEPGGAYTLLDTGDPQHALRLAREQPIHLVITDVVMPLMKGTELAARMQTMSPSTKILLMSAYTMSEVTGTGWAFISKPFSMQALNDKVRQILGQRSPFARPSRPA